MKAVTAPPSPVVLGWVRFLAPDLSGVFHGRGWLHLVFHTQQLVKSDFEVLVSESVHDGIRPRVDHPNQQQKRDCHGWAVWGSASGN